MYIFYFVAFGIIGNLLTCFLVIRRIIKLRRRCKQALKEGCTSELHQIYLADKIHNSNIYNYFAAIILCDLIVLINWILSEVMVNVEVKKTLRYEHDTSLLTSKSSFIVETLPSSSLMINDNRNREQLLVKFDNYSQLDEMFPSFANKLNISNDSYTSFSTILIDINEIIQHFHNEFHTTKTKIVNLQFVCQLHYYLTFVSLYGIFSFTLACLFDRFLKMKVIQFDEILSHTNTRKQMHHLQTSKSNANIQEEIEMNNEISIELLKSKFILFCSAGMNRRETLKYPPIVDFSMRLTYSHA
jgi:hypothetical protein